MTWMLVIVMLAGPEDMRVGEIGVFNTEADCYVAGNAIAVAAIIDTGIKTLFMCTQDW